MNSMERQLFEAYAVLQAHVNRLQALVQQGVEDQIVEQLGYVKQAAEMLAKLPRPQQKAA